MLLTDWWIVLPFEATNHRAARNIYMIALSLVEVITVLPEIKV